MSNFVSYFKIGGFPILPPLMTNEVRDEMRNYRNLAIAIEKRMQTNACPSHNGTEISSIEMTIPKQCSDEQVEKSVTENDLEKIRKLTISEVNIVSNLDDSINISEDLSVSVNTSRFPYFMSENEDLSMTKSDCDYNDITDDIQDAESDSMDDNHPRLFRSNSYTLDSPSPLFLKHLKDQGMEVNSNQLTFRKWPDVMPESSNNAKKAIPLCTKEKREMKTKVQLKKKQKIEFPKKTSQQRITAIYKPKKNSITSMHGCESIFKTAQIQLGTKSAPRMLTKKSNSNSSTSELCSESYVVVNDSTFKEDFSEASSIKLLPIKKRSISPKPPSSNQNTRPISSPRKAAITRSETPKSTMHTTSATIPLTNVPKISACVQNNNPESSTDIAEPIRTEISTNKIQSPEDKFLEYLTKIEQNHQTQMTILIEQQQIEQKRMQETFLRQQELLIQQITANQMAAQIPHRAPSPRMTDSNSSYESANNTASSKHTTPTHCPIEFNNNNQLYLEHLKNNNSSAKTRLNSTTEIECLNTISKSSSCNRRLFQQDQQEEMLANKQKALTSAATIINSFARGYLVRRLIKTEDVQSIIKVIRDTLLFILDLHDEATVEHNPADIKLKRNLLQQLNNACFSLHDIFFGKTIPEKMEIIATDREIMRRKCSKTRLSNHSITASASNKSINNLRKTSLFSVNIASNTSIDRSNLNDSTTT